MTKHLKQTVNITTRQAYIKHNKSYQTAKNNIENNQHQQNNKKQKQNNTINIQCAMTHY